MNDRECVGFLQWALPRLRMRWPGFRKVRGQVCKRLRRRLGELGLTDTGEYRVYLEEHPEEWETFDRLCVVTIARFHRDRQVFRYLREGVLAELAERAAAAGRPLRCWSVGCASGEEPYTLSLIWQLDLRDRFPNTDLKMLATDTHPELLERARTGRFAGSSLRGLEPEWVEAAFDPSEGDFLLRPQYRAGVEFLLSDIRREIQPGLFDLILCRNLAFTYFEHDLQREILEGLTGVLVPGGVLVIGSHETLPEGPWSLEALDLNLPIFRNVFE